ncbi:MAG TPA: DUF4743 domain-containing protein [Alphaproteobacteria bacterium]|nr:DUF4743 domain-containing protein [Alphaproteobacteria bacterium]
MGYLRHIRASNAHDLGGFRRFLVDGRQVGWVRHAVAERLAAERSVFEVAPAEVRLAPALGTFDERSRAVAGVVARLVEEGILEKLRREEYSVRPRWGEAPLLKLDRGAVALFGVKAFGIHVNGYVRRKDRIHLWVGRRSPDRRVAPGKLDNLVAGGLPHGLTLQENLVKEAKEEADIDAALARRSVPVGTVTYAMEQEAGLKPDTLFNYDLELDEAFRPRNTDGEVAGFELWPVEEVARAIRETDEFKFNVNHVNIDFLIRHGVIGPDEPDYVELATGLHGTLPE